MLNSVIIEGIVVDDTTINCDKNLVIVEFGKIVPSINSIVRIVGKLKNNKIIVENLENIGAING